MIELTIRIKCADKSDKIRIELNPNQFDASSIEKDVCRGLYPLVASLLNQVLGQEGFQKSDEEKLVDKTGAPLSEDFMVANGMVEPEEGSPVINLNQNDKNG